MAKEKSVINKTKELKSIGDAESGAKVIMHVYGNNGNKLDFETEAVKESSENKNSAESLVVTALRYDGKILNFNGVKVIAEVAMGSMVYKFNIDGVDIVNINNTRYHSLNCSRQSEGQNRRGSVRVALSVGAIAQLDLNKQAVDCNVKDLSAGGIGLIFNEQRNIEVGATMNISFTYDHEQFKVAANVVRVSFDENQGRTFVGLQFAKEFDEIRAVVIQLQRKELGKLNHDKLKAGR